jgi:hypothetical protein
VSGKKINIDRLGSDTDSGYPRDDGTDRREFRMSDYLAAVLSGVTGATKEGH